MNRGLREARFHDLQDMTAVHTSLPKAAKGRPGVVQRVYQAVVRGADFL